jgi:hypothetical protein
MYRPVLAATHHNEHGEQLAAHTYNNNYYCFTFFTAVELIIYLV